MEVLACVELDMSSEEFYSCSWYDWSLKLEKIRNDRRKRTEDHELLIEMVRSGLCFYYNWNSEKTKINPTDLWKLSYDKQDTQIREGEEEKMKETIQRLERIAKKKKRG